MSQEWKLVPVVPTEEMLNVLHDRVLISVNARKQEANILNDKAWWAAVVSAAPVPPAGDLPERMDAPSRDEYELECYWAAAVEQAKAHNDCLDACAPIVARLQAENAALQQRLNTADQRGDELEPKAKLYDQLQRGAELLPEGWIITVEIERDGGGVTLIDPQGNDFDYPSNRESMGDEVEDAIEEALSQQANP